MPNDLEFAGEGDVDPNFELIFGGEAPDREAERRTGGRTIPKHDFYVLEFEGGKNKFTNAGEPGFGVMARVVEGIEGTEGAVVFGKQYLTVKPTKVINSPNGKAEVARTPEEVEKAAGEIRATLAKLVRVFGAQTWKPSGLTPDELDVYAAQFRGRAVAAVSFRKESTGPDGTVYPESNEIVLRSLAALDEPVEHRSGKLKGQPTGETALDEARRKISEYNKKALSKGASGRTAGSVGGPTTATEFD